MPFADWAWGDVWLHAVCLLCRIRKVSVRPTDHTYMRKRTVSKYELVIESGYYVTRDKGGGAGNYYCHNISSVTRSETGQNRACDVINSMNEPFAGQGKH